MRNPSDFNGNAKNALVDVGSGNSTCEYIQMKVGSDNEPVPYTATPIVVIIGSIENTRI